MNIALIGATGAVGREMLRELEKSPFIQGDTELSLFASERSQGQFLRFRERSLKVRNVTELSGDRFDFVLMSAGSHVSCEYAPILAAHGAIVIDNSSAFRMDEDVPLVVPEVNGSVLAGLTSGIIANPNCSTIQLVVSLCPLQRLAGLETVILSTYQSVSGSGQKGIDELSRQLHSDVRTPDVYPQPIAFNVISHIGALTEGGPCEEELKIIRESRKILNLPDLSVLVTTARVPVYHCHCESVVVQLQQAVDLAEVDRAFGSMPGLICHAPDLSVEELPSPYHCTERPEVFVSRLRLLWGEHRSRWLQYWNVADNLKKGAATNAVQIMEQVLRQRQL
ncbi:MAG: aspartate-semialdehyde dehydrogenase [Deltaproteobacteria bacterium]|nr:aspartate-semialdehyde dehydrogenase [Deltaproteobacteria bacterium]